MKDKNIDIRVVKIIFGVISLGIILVYTSLTFMQTVKPVPNAKVETNHDTLCPIFTRNEKNMRDVRNADEKRIARHFAHDTLPGLVKAGLINKYQCSNKGTYLFVTGNLWSARSQFFKSSLLTEVYIYNKINGYGLSTSIIDTVSGKLYAQISSSAKIDFYD